MKMSVYKAIDRDTGRWIYGTPGFSNIGKDAILSLITSDGERTVLPESVCLGMGANDSTGQPIFTGDYLAVKGPKKGSPQHLFEVKYGPCGGLLSTPTGKGYVGFYVGPADKHTESEMKQGLRTDILYYLGCCSCLIVGNKITEKDTPKKFGTNTAARGQLPPAEVEPRFNRPVS